MREMNFFLALLLSVGIVDPNVMEMINVFRLNGGVIPIHQTTFVMARRPVLMRFLRKREEAAIMLTCM